MRFKRVCRRDGTLFRLFRITWDVGNVGDGKGYSRKISVGFRPKLFLWRRELSGWFLIIAGIRLHSATSYGGRFAD